jgi:hypothetical protein
MVLRDEFIVTKKDGTVRIFKQSEKGLYYLDTTQSESNHAVLINTVTNNQYKYSLLTSGTSKKNTKNHWAA